MSSLPDPSAVKVYTVNGATSSSSSSLPDWLTRKRAAQSGGGKSKRTVREHVEGTLELIQHFEFPEASNKVKTTRDGHHAIATGTYKPQIRVWDLDQLALKFERHSDAENVDFIMLSDDWTKSVHLQNDRTIELHAQGGLHYKTRIPKFGRALAYHYPSCDTLFSASGNEIYRLNLDQGRYLAPLVLGGENVGDEVEGVNCIDINPAHQLFAFGVDGNGLVELWDPRSRTRVGRLRLPQEKLLPLGSSGGLADDRPTVAVTAITSRVDGLSYAIGTSTGHTLLYDIRSAKPFATKDQGYGLPVKCVSWIEGGSRMAGDGLVLSADKKVIKIWDRNSPATNFTSITPANDINHVHHLPGSGLILLANEGIKMTSYFVPQLGPAPKWCSFLENLTEELEDQTTRTAYQDFKFVDRKELATLGLDHLIGTPALKPYMHGYFLSLQLYDTARVVANPYAYAEHREKLVQEKMEKMAETRIRSSKNTGASVKVNKALAERITKEEEREKKREERKRKEGDKDDMDVDGAEEEEEEWAGEKTVTRAKPSKANLLSDSRFKALFENPEFQVDERSREYALLHPSEFSQRQNFKSSAGTSADGKHQGRTKTAVEEEEEEIDKVSSDGLGYSDSGEEKEGEEDQQGSEDSDDAGALWEDSIRARMAARSAAYQPRAGFSSRRQKLPPSQRQPKVKLVPFQPPTASSSNTIATFGQRRSQKVNRMGKGKGRGREGLDSARTTRDAGMEITFLPKFGDELTDDVAKPRQTKARRKGVETFGAGLERYGEGYEGEPVNGGNENERKGRTKRRTGMRSGSKNTFRRI